MLTDDKINNILNADEFLRLLNCVRQVLDNGQQSQVEYGIIIKSKAAWTALKNASDYYTSLGIQQDEHIIL